MVLHILGNEDPHTVRVVLRTGQVHSFDKDQVSRVEVPHDADIKSPAADAAVAAARSADTKALRGRIGR